MPSDLHRQLQAAAEVSRHTVGEEIRRRLEASFAGGVPTKVDQPTLRLLSAIKAAADELEQSGPISEMLGLPSPLGAWYADPVSYAALSRAIPQFMSLTAVCKSGGTDDGAVKVAEALALRGGLRAMVVAVEPAREDQP